MTQQEFDRLPALIPRKVFLLATGLPECDVYAMIRAGQLKVFRRPWRGSARHRRLRRTAALYYKSEAGRLGGFKL